MASRIVSMKKGGPAGAVVFVTHVPTHLGDGPGNVSDHAPTPLHYNDYDAPPLVAFASDKYIDRPLPAPPIRKSKMAERPSTSSGSSSQSQGKNNINFDKYDKRVSRDDFHLSMRPHAGTGFKFNEAPFRGQLPTPEASPISKAAPQQAVSVVRMSTPESFDDARSVPIGMALGSPTHHPASWSNYNKQPLLPLEPSQVANPVSPMSVASSLDSYDMPKPKKQPGKWKLFGGMFGRKQIDRTESAVAISEPNQLKGTYRPEQVTPKPQPETSSRPMRSNTTSFRKASKHKPLVVRSQTMPHDEHPKVQKNIASSKPVQDKRLLNASVDTFGNSSTSGGRSTSNFGSIPIALDTTAPTKSSSGGLLDVEIPSVHLERYSVMFSDVLHPQPASSLLARRQATLDRLKTINDAIVSEEHAKKTAQPRRATSPQPNKSPAFALFPPTPTGRQSSHQPSLSRSNTSPALLRPPSKDKFDKPGNFHGDMTPPNASAIPSPLHVTKPNNNSPERTGFYFTQDHSGLISQSPTDVEDSDPEFIRGQFVRRKIESPKWQMMVPPQPAPSTASSVTSSRKHSPSSISSAQTHMTKPWIDVEDTSNMNPVELSIARQISISRQQRKMLQPLQTSFTVNKTKTSPARVSPIPLAMGQHERLAETKSATPTLVTPRGGLDPSVAAHRKSERVVLEG